MTRPDQIHKNRIIEPVPTTTVVGKKYIERPEPSKSKIRYSLIAAKILNYICKKQPEKPKIRTKT